MIIVKLLQPVETSKDKRKKTRTEAIFVPPPVIAMKLVLVIPPAGDDKLKHCNSQDDKLSDVTSPLANQPLNDDDSFNDDEGDENVAKRFVKLC